MSEHVPCRRFSQTQVLTRPLFLETLRRLVPVAQQQKALANLGTLVTLGHDVERDPLGDPQALAVEVILSFRVVARGDSADWFSREGGLNQRLRAQDLPHARRLTAGEEERAAAPRRGRSVDLGVENGRMPTAVLKVERKQLDNLFDRDNLFFEEGRRHPLFDDDAA